jgi:hypothetical protein
MRNKTYDIKGLSAWAIKGMYKKANQSGHIKDANALRKAFILIYEDEKHRQPVLAECCGCSCEKCSHQGGSNKHTPECIQIWHNRQQKFKVI